MRIFISAKIRNVDCLLCHDGSGIYIKDDGGIPAEGVDLLALAKSVRLPGRENCGIWHINGGGGNGVKHGDLDQSLNFPSETLDIHMGGNNLPALIATRPNPQNFGSIDICQQCPI